MSDFVLVTADVMLARWHGFARKTTSQANASASVQIGGYDSVDQDAVRSALDVGP